MSDAHNSPPAPNADSITLVNALMTQLNITADQLAASAHTALRPVPTFDEYLPQVRAAVSQGTQRVYGTYWKRISATWGSRRLNEPTPTEIKELANHARENAIVRRNSRGGGSAAEHLIAALRCIYRHAIDDRIISAANNPAARVAKPRRQQSLRQALPEQALAEIFTVAETTGNDPHLDTLILRLHRETACRLGGALSATRADLDVDQCLIRLHEKGGTQRWQPISPTLTAALAAHHEQRAADDPHGPLLRYRNGQPVTARRYDNIWTRIRDRLPWAQLHQVSAHWLRHTTLTWVERHFSPAVAQAYAGHAGTGDLGTTGIYTKANQQEVARALAALTGEHHPLASADPMTAFLTRR